MTYLKLDADRLLAVVDGLNALAGTPPEPEMVAEAGAQIAGNLTEASGAWVHCGYAGLETGVGWGDKETAGSELSVPLENSGDRIGRITVVKRGDSAFGDGDHEAVRLLAVNLAAQLVNAVAYQQSTLESRVDALTGLGNNLAFGERLEWEMSRSGRYSEDLSLTVFEIEDLPGLIERFGPGGSSDGIIVEVAEILSRGRAADSCYRIESDTFMVLMPNTNSEGAEIATIRMAWEVANAHGGDGTVRVFTGVAQADVPDPRELHAAAMAALRAGKASNTPA